MKGNADNVATAIGSLASFICRPAIAALALSFLSATQLGCSHKAPKVASPDGNGSLPESINYTPFPTSVALAEVENGEPFLSAIMKVTLVPYPDGSWRFDRAQEEITNGSVMSKECPSAPDLINDGVGFRRKAEIYIRPNTNDGKKVTLRVGSTSIPLSFRNKCRVFDTPADVVLVPYLSDGEKLSVTGMNGAVTKNFTIPDGLTPFLIVRYTAGQVIFTPTRLDTVTLDTEHDRMILVYRATMPAAPQIRKVEFAAVLPRAMRKSTDPQERERDEATVRYLHSCPVPQEPVEPCSLPTTKQNPQLFGLGGK